MKGRATWIGLMTLQPTMRRNAVRELIEVFSIRQPQTSVDATSDLTLAGASLCQIAENLILSVDSV